MVEMIKDQAEIKHLPVLLKDYVCGDHRLYHRILVEEAAVIAYKETSMAFFV